MTTYREKVSEIREKIDLIIEEVDEKLLSSPQIVEKALMVEVELSALK